MELLNRMIDLRLRPNTHCFNVVIQALVDADQVEEVSSFIRSLALSDPTPLLMPVKTRRCASRLCVMWVRGLPFGLRLRTAIRDHEYTHTLLYIVIS